MLGLRPITGLSERMDEIFIERRFDFDKCLTFETRGSMSYEKVGHIARDSCVVVHCAWASILRYGETETPTKWILIVRWESALDNCCVIAAMSPNQLT